MRTKHDYSGREKERGQGTGAAVKEAEVHVLVDAGQLTHELCTWSVSVPDFLHFQGGSIVSKLCGT